MYAFEARKESIQPQFNNALELIKEAVSNGRKDAMVYQGNIYPEVAKMLTEHGYDVTIVRGKMFPFCQASWENAEEGKAGELTYVDEPDGMSSIAHAIDIGLMAGIIGKRMDDDDEEEEEDEDAVQAE